MTDPSPVNVELAIVLPLAVVMNQLVKVEADLRFLNMKTQSFAQGQTSDASRQVAGHLATINDTLDSIRGLVSEFETDTLPRSVGSARNRKPHPSRED